MSDQTTVNRLNGNRRRSGDSHGQAESNSRASGFKQLVADVTELVELQIRLLTGDLKQTVYRVVVPLALLVVGGALLLGGIPVLAAAVAKLMVTYGNWSEWAALMLSGGVILACSVVLLWVAVVRLRRCVSPLERSVHELSKNLAALRGIIVERHHQD